MSFMDSLREGRIGRVPVWAVGVALAGIIILFVVVRNRLRGNSAPDGGFGSESVEGIPAESFAAQLSGSYPQNISTLPAPTRPLTNAQWLIAAFDYLAGLGRDPSLIQQALQKYLAGTALSNEERDLVNLATTNSSLSLPPEGVVLPVPGTPAPPAPVTPGTPAQTVPERVSVPLDTDLYVWVQGLNSGYGLNLTFVRMFGNFTGDPSALNPLARNYMSWDEGPGYKIPKFTRPTPPMRIR